MQEKRKTVSTTTATSKIKYVKCKLCGKSLDSTQAYCVIKGPQKIYCCSKEEYDGGEEYVKEHKRIEAKIILYIKEIINSDDFPLAFYESQLVEWYKYARADILEDFLYEKKEEYRTTLDDKGINNAYSRLRYLGAIIISNIIKYARTKSAVQKKIININSDIIVDEGIVEPCLTPRKGLRRSLEDLEDMYGGTD